MAVSPLIVHSTDAAPQASRAVSSPLKRQQSAVPSPKPTRPAGQRGDVQPPVTSDLVEQLNEEEKRKYVKDEKEAEEEESQSDKKANRIKRQARSSAKVHTANVYLGHARHDKSILVAIKKIKVQKEFKDGLAPDAVRELKHLQELRHPNIISLLSVFSSKDQNLNLVLEYLPLGDLEMLIRDVERVRYGAADIKAWMGMLGRAVWFCHANSVLHRDIKPNNLLIGADGEVKLADFGLARSFADPAVQMTSNVITRWYRPPELLFGAKHYSGAVDIWSVGLVFAELILRNPYMPGNTEIEQIQLICRQIGTPTEDNWPGVSRLPGYTVPAEIVPMWDKAAYMSRFGAVGTEGVDLLVRMLTLDPRRRITARELLEHRWWRSDPKPTRKEDLPRKSDGEDKAITDLKKRPGLIDEDGGSSSGGGRGAKVARKLDFGAATGK